MRLSAGNYLLFVNFHFHDWFYGAANYISPITFSSQLRDDCLSATTASCPLIESLVLMSCPSIGSDGLSSLNGLPNLTVLDLSYTFLMNLEPVFKSCIQLKVRHYDLYDAECYPFLPAAEHISFSSVYEHFSSYVLCILCISAIHVYFYHILLLFGLALILLLLGTQITSLQVSHWLIIGASLQRRCFAGTRGVGPVLWNSLSDCDRWSTCVLHTLDSFEFERLC